MLLKSRDSATWLNLAYPCCWSPGTPAWPRRRPWRCRAGRWWGRCGAGWGRADGAAGPRQRGPRSAGSPPAPGSPARPPAPWRRPPPPSGAGCGSAPAPSSSRWRRRPARRRWGCCWRGPGGCSWDVGGRGKLLVLLLWFLLLCFFVAVAVFVVALLRFVFRKQRGYPWNGAIGSLKENLFLMFCCCCCWFLFWFVLLLFLLQCCCFFWTRERLYMQQSKGRPVFLSSFHFVCFFICFVPFSFNFVFVVVVKKCFI